MYKGKKWKEYKRGEVREHSMWMKESKCGRGHQRRCVWTKEVERSIATSGRLVANEECVFKSLLK